jgi:hypothetical protein
MTEQTDPGTARRRWPGAVLLVLAVLFSLVMGVTTASAEGSLGPHEARYDVTTDDTVTLDLGPLGTLQIASPLPLTLGVRVTVQEIPEGLTEVTSATTLAALGNDLQSYVQLFSAPRPTVEAATRELVRDAIGRATTWLVVLVGAWWLLRVLLGPARRRELGERVAPHERQIAVGCALVLVGATVLTASSIGGSHGPQGEPASPVFDGTALAGARVTGRLGGVIDTYGAQALAAYEDNQRFYARADANLVVAWRDRQAAIDAQAAAAAAAAQAQAQAQADAEAAAASAAPTPTTPAGLEAPTQPPLAVPTDQPTIGPSPTPTLGPTAGPTPGPTPTTAPEDLVTVVLMSDLHCNVGMAPLVHTLAVRSHARLVLDAGDTTMDGTAVEQFCVTTFADAIPKGVDLVTSPGNHDSRDTSAHYASAGAKVLDGKVVTVDGLRILGDHDPNETRLGAGTSQKGTESAVDEGARLAQTACEDEDGVDLLLIHTPDVGLASLESGCVPAQISGHLHKRYGPEQVGAGIRYISSSSAGATLGKPTIGPLNGTAELTVLRWDPGTRRFVDHQLVQVRTDASVTVGPRVPWPVPTPVAQIGTPDTGPSSPTTGSPTPGATGG